jgi:glycosyltransferase involved in cell wall biosynthesis
VRVAIDATSWHNRRGFGRFTRNAVGRLLELHPETDFVLIANEATDRGFPTGVQLRTVSGPETAGEGPSAGGSRSLRELGSMMTAVRRREFDVVLFPSVYSYFPVLRVPTVVGLHDTTPENFPKLVFASRREQLAWRLKQSLAIRRASGLFAVSAAARAAVAERFALDPEAIPVVGEAPDPAFRPRPAADQARARSAVGLAPREQFVVYAAGISPHKNVEALIEAFARLKPACRLVVVGELEGTYLSSSSSVSARIKSLSLESRVLLPGFVSDDDLASLYSAAAAAVVTSLSEGFGLPAVEAAACGAATILSDLPAHRETLGAASTFFPPGDVSALAAALDLVLHDEDLRRSSADRALAAVRPLSWDRTATVLHRLLLDTVEAT